jgi:NADPH:quinone reductase-like Zn-dependent oxidoreductase
MRAVFYRRPGPPDVLELGEMPEPRISAREVLVRVRAAGVNPVDCKLRAMRIRPPWQRFPVIPGSDVAGEVVRVGDSVTRFQPGDAVYAMLSPFKGGAYAEYAAVPERQAAHKPANLDYEAAASVPIAGLTALQALRDDGRVKPGDRVLINGASGGVGSFAVQVAKALGAMVTAVTSGRNVEWVKALGADRVVDYEREDFTRSGERYAVVFDTVSSSSFGRCKPILTPHGTYVRTLPSVSTILHAATSALSLGRRARIFFLRPRAEDLDQLRELIEAGRVAPRVERVFALAQAAHAHAASESGHSRGKLVLRVAGLAPVS